MLTHEQIIRAFLRSYAWLDDTDEEKDREVDCIMSQDDWEFLDVRADQFAAAQEQPGPRAFSEGVMMALTGLYECHDGPHLPACPRNRGNHSTTGGP